MINIDKGRYWDKALSLVSGCTPCSPGCDHCWAASLEHRTGARISKGFEGSFSDNTICGHRVHTPSPLTTSKRQFNRKIILHPERLDIPLKRKKPTVYAVWNDLFHEDVPFDFIDVAYNTMAQATQHTYLILTKRHRRISEYFESCLKRRFPVARWMSQGLDIWHGLTVCNQEEWDEKSKLFLQIPGNKFISHEPALRRINYGSRLNQINCLISGGETGPGARPSHPDTFRSNRDQCQSAGVSFFFKGWGEWAESVISDKDKRASSNDKSMWIFDGGFCKNARINCGDGAVWMRRVGRKQAGRKLDGRTHDDLLWFKEAK